MMKIETSKEYPAKLREGPRVIGAALLMMNAADYIEKLEAELSAALVELKILREEGQPCEHDIVLLEIGHTVGAKNGQGILDAVCDYVDQAERRLAAVEAEKDVFFNLTDRAVKMLWLAIPETREPVHSESHNPITAWVADANQALAQRKGGSDE